VHVIALVHVIPTRYLTAIYTVNTYICILASLNDYPPKVLPSGLVNMWTSGNPKLLLFTISGLLTTALVEAQNSSCSPTDLPDFKNVNSTGQYEFTWNSSYAGDNPWYISVLVGSQGTEWDSRRDVRAQAYISVPGNVPKGTGFCGYQYTNINATLESGGENSCSGVISSDCIDHLTKALKDSANNCPDSNTGSTSEAFKKACPMLKGGSHSTFIPQSLHKPHLCSFFSSPA
jgi:hypothetical protein